MKKIDFAINHFKNNLSIFCCPFCSSNLSIIDNSLICLNNHTFNISRKGTVILHKTSKIKKDKLYNHDLFVNRRKFINFGFYDELYNKIGKIVNQYNINTILDMGSGEGSHDVKIMKMLSNEKLIIGVDLSKEGIDLSNDFLENDYLGIVGDLNRLPLKDRSIDLILNILSPSNEEEMKRVLKTDGFIIKVTPKTEYLMELRKSFSFKDYQNENILDQNIRQKYHILAKEEVVNTYSVTDDILKCLINMTPLTNHVHDIPKIDFITIALNVYVLRIKKDEG